MTEGMFDPDLLKPGPSTGGNGRAGPDDGDDHLTQFLEDTLGSVLRSARESASDLMEKARRASEEEAAISRQLREEAQREVDRMAAWSLQVDPLVQAAYQKAEAIRERVAEAPGRITEALAPVKDALVDMDEVMARLTEALRPPATGPGGNGGPSGPNGGSRSYAPAEDVPAEPVRERVSAVRDAGDDDADAGDELEPAETSAMNAAAEPVAMHAVEEPEPEPEPTEVPQAEADEVPQAVADEVQQAEEVEVPQAAVQHDDVVATPTSRWVDAPSDDDRTEPEAAPAAEADAGQADAGSMDAADDDDALLSTTTQLRRVAEIDWHDLPSVSNG